MLDDRKEIINRYVSCVFCFGVLVSFLSCAVLYMVKCALMLLAHYDCTVI